MSELIQQSWESWHDQPKGDRIQREGDENGPSLHQGDRSLAMEGTLLGGDHLNYSHFRGG